MLRIETILRTLLVKIGADMVFGSVKENVEAFPILPLGTMIQAARSLK